MSEEKDECACCGFPAENLIEFQSKSQGNIKMCDLCYNTPTGTHFVYQQKDGVTAMLQTICYIGNAIMAQGGKHK